MEKRVSELEMKLETVSKERRDLEQKYWNITEYLGIENKENAYETEHEKSEKIRDALSPSSSTHNNRDWGILLFHEKFHNL